VTQVVKVLKGHAGGSIVIEHDVRDAGCVAVDGDSDDGKGYIDGKFCVDEKKAIDAAAHEELLVLLSEIGLAEMAHGKGEETLLQEILLDAEHYASDVSFAEFWNDDADGVSESGTQDASVQVGAISEFLRRSVDALLGLGWDGFSDGRVIENNRDCGGGEV